MSKIEENFKEYWPKLPLSLRRNLKNNVRPWSAAVKRSNCSYMYGQLYTYLEVGVVDSGTANWALALIDATITSDQIKDLVRSA